MRFCVIVIFFSVMFGYGQQSLVQQKPEIAFGHILNQYNISNYQALVPAIHSFYREYGQNTRFQSEIQFFEAVTAARLNQPDAIARLTRFAVDFPLSPRVSVATFEAASLFYRAKNYPKTIEELGRMDFSGLSKGQNLEARFMWGYSYFNLKKFNEALEQFNLVKNSESIFSPAAAYYAGYLELSNGAYENALRDLLPLEKQGSYATVVPYLIAQVYYKQGKDNEVIRYAALLKDKEEVQNLGEINLLAAEAHFRKKNYPLAVDGYRAFLGNASSGDRGVLFRMGYALFSTNQTKEAAEFFKKSASDKDTTGLYASYYLGISHLKLSQKNQALTAFQVAKKLQNDPKMGEECSFQLSKLLYDLGRPDEAIDEMEAFQKKYPASLHYNEIGDILSAAYVNTSSYHKAIAHIESLPSRTPAANRTYQKATYHFGTELYNKSEYANALEYFTKSLSYTLDEAFTAKANLWSGECWAIQGDWARAGEFYERGLALKPDAETTARLRFGLGYARYNQQQFDKALYSFKEFVALAAKNDPDLANGYVRLADCYYVAKNYNEAVKNYQTTYSLNRSDQDYAHLQAGLVLGILDRDSEAITEFDQVVTRYRQSAYWEEAHFQRAQVQFKTSNYNEAQAGFTTLINQRPASRFAPYGYARRAASYFNLKDYNKTANDYEYLLEHFPNHPAAKDVILPLQEALNLAGRGNEFDKHLQQFKKANPGNAGLEKVEFESAQNLYLTQEYGRAVVALTNFISSYPASLNLTDARYFRAESYFRLKDLPKALAAYYEIFDADAFAFANKVAGRIADIEFRSGQYEKAITANRKLNKLAANAKEKYASVSGLMESFFILGQLDSAQRYASRILTDEGASPVLVNRAGLLSGQVAMAKGDYETAQDELLAVVNNATDETGAEAKYRVAEVQSLTKAFPQSNETLFALNREYGAYPLWVGKGFILIADNYAALGNNFQAKATLNSLIEKFPLDIVKNEARAKLKQLEEGDLKAQVKQDSTDNK